MNYLILPPRESEELEDLFDEVAPPELDIFELPWNFQKHHHEINALALENL